MHTQAWRGAVTYQFFGKLEALGGIICKEDDDGDAEHNCEAHVTTPVHGRSGEAG